MPAVTKKKTSTRAAPAKKTQKSKSKKQTKKRAANRLPVTPFGPVNTLKSRSETTKAKFDKQAVHFHNYLQKSAIEGCGYGLFAGKNYKKGEYVERNPYMILRHSDVRADSWTLDALDCYWFESTYPVPIPASMKHTLSKRPIKTDGSIDQHKNQRAIPMKDSGVLVMGPASMMNSGCAGNHLENVDACGKPEDIWAQGRTMDFTAKRDIKKGEELFINYGQEWFDTHDL